MRSIDTTNIDDETEQQYISFVLKPITPDMMRDDLNTFLSTELSTKSTKGTRFLYYFFFREMLSVRGRYGSFFDICKNWDHHMSKRYISNFANTVSIKNQSNHDFTIYHLIYDVARLYLYQSIHIMKPAFIFSILKQFQPFRVLDPCAGWGSRMLACMKYGCGYIGFDTNPRLKMCYDEMLTDCNIDGMDVTLRIQDCLEGMVDFVDMYDMVFTSPPYYNYEVYNGMPERTKEEWHRWYVSVFRLAFTGLLVGGHMCINVCKEIYDNCLRVEFGESDYVIEYPKTSRNQTDKSEYLYIWRR